MCAWLLILCALCGLGATSAQAVDASGLGKIAVASGAADWGIGALQQALDAQMSAVYNVSRAVVVGMGAAEMLDATNNFIDSRPETQYAAGRITLPDLVSTWLNEYARAKSIEDLGQIYEQLQSGITVDSDGVMYYNGQACEFMDEFLGWVWLSGPKLSEYADTVTVGTGGYSYNGVPLASFATSMTVRARLMSPSRVENYNVAPEFFYMTSSTSGVTIGGSGSVQVYGYSGSRAIYAIGSGSIHTVEYSASGYTVSGTTEKPLWTVNAQGKTLTDGAFVSIGTYPSSYYQLNIPVFNKILTLDDLVEDEPEEVPKGNPGLFTGITSLSVDPSDFVTVQQPEGDGWKVAPSEWLRVVTDVVSGNDQTTMTVTQDDTGVTQHVVVRPSDLPGVPGDPVLPAPEINPTVPDTTVPTFDLPDITGDWNGTSAYEVNIRDLFPFCIPFDILDACQLFAAEPVAPAFSIPIKSEAYGIDEIVEFDLSPFDGVASAVRTMEKVAFLVGLALVTKQLLGG